MRYLVSAEEMREYDSNTIEKIGIPACVLMERAALAAADRIEEYFESSGASRHVLVMAGTGNNGGDGLAVARLLSERDYQVEVWTVGDPGKCFRQADTLCSWSPRTMEVTKPDTSDASVP